MQAVRRRIRKVVKVMTDPRPEFVSLVNHGANQTPFRVVKAAGGVEVAVLSFEFDKKVFKSEDAVSEFLDARGWTDYSVTSDSKVYRVAGASEDEIDGDTETITQQKGVVMKVGKLKAGTESAPGGQTEETQKSVEPVKRSADFEAVKKFSDWMTYYSDDKTIAGVVEDASQDGLPPGFNDVASAFIAALRNSFKDNDMEAVRALGTEFSDIVIALAQLFSRLDDEMVEKMMAKSPVTASEAAATTAAEETTKSAPVTEAPAAPAATEEPQAAAPATAEETAEKTAPAVSTSSEETSGEQKTEKAADSAADLIAQVTKGIGAAIGEALKPIQEAIATLQTDVAAVKAAAPATEGNEAAPVAVQSRKSGELEETQHTKTQKTVEELAVERKRAERQTRGVLGL